MYSPVAKSPSVSVTARVLQTGSGRQPGPQWPNCPLMWRPLESRRVLHHSLQWRVTSCCSCLVTGHLLRGSPVTVQPRWVRFLNTKGSWHGSWLSRVRHSELTLATATASTNTSSILLILVH